MKASNAVSAVKTVNGELEMDRTYLFLGNEKESTDSFKFTVLKKTPKTYTILVNGLQRYNLKNDTNLFTSIQDRMIYEIQE